MQKKYIFKFFISALMLFMGLSYANAQRIIRPIPSVLKTVTINLTEVDTLTEKQKAALNFAVEAGVLKESITNERVGRLLLVKRSTYSKDNKDLFSCKLSKYNTVSGLTGNDNFSIATSDYPAAMDSLTADEKTSLNLIETIKFVLSNDYIVQVSGGTPAKDTVTAGDTVQISYVPGRMGVGGALRLFGHWTVKSGNVTLEDSTASTTTFVMPYSDVNISCVYKRVNTSKTYVVDFKGSGEYTDEPYTLPMSDLIAIRYAHWSNNIELGTIDENSRVEVKRNNKTLFSLIYKDKNKSYLEEGNVSSVCSKTVDSFFNFTIAIDKNSEVMSQLGDYSSYLEDYDSISFQFPNLIEYEVSVNKGYASVDWARQGDTVMIYAVYDAEKYDFVKWSSTDGKDYNFGDISNDTTYFIMSDMDVILTPTLVQKSVDEETYYDIAAYNGAKTSVEKAKTGDTVMVYAVYDKEKYDFGAWECSDERVKFDDVNSDTTFFVMQDKSIDIVYTVNVRSVGVETIENDLLIYVSGDVVYNSEKVFVRVYNISGQLIYSGAESSIVLNRGVYFIEAEGSVQKVVIK